MADTAFKGNPIHTSGELPAVGSAAPDFQLVGQDLSTASLATYEGKKKILNVFPSLDTPVCATTVRTFNQKAAAKDGVVVLNISADLPFASKRFCAAEGIEVAVTLSSFRGSFARDYGTELTDGPLVGLNARAVLVLNEQNQVVHHELVSDIVQEPDYEAALSALA